MSIANKVSKGKGICNHGQRCCPHNVTIYTINGSADSNAEGSGIVGKGDSVKTTCPHCGKGNVTGASNTVLVNGKGVARKGDKVKLGGGNGNITTTTKTTIAG